MEESNLNILSCMTRVLHDPWYYLNGALTPCGIPRHTLHTLHTPWIHGCGICRTVDETTLVSWLPLYYDQVNLWPSYNQVKKRLERETISNWMTMPALPALLYACYGLDGWVSELQCSVPGQGSVGHACSMVMYVIREMVGLLHALPRRFFSRYVAIY